jgi:hypothetical protein
MNAFNNLNLLAIVPPDNTTKGQLIRTMEPSEVFREITPIEE